MAVHRAEHDGVGAGDEVGRPITPGLPPGRKPDTADLTAAVRAAQDGDEEAFRLLFRTVQPGLLRYLRVLLAERAAEVEDVASEAWLQIARDLATFEGDGDGFRGWAATIARNRAMDHLRKLRRRPNADIPVEHLLELAGGEDTAGTAMASVATVDALALIARLPRDQAEAVLLRVVLDLDAESAARVLGKRAGSVRMAAHRGLRKLAKLLEQSGGRSAGVPSQAAGEGRDRGTDRGAGRSSGRNSPPGVTPERAATLKDTR